MRKAKLEYSQNFGRNQSFFATSRATGRGTVTLVEGSKRESYNVERGDVMKLDAGSVVYTLNRDNREKLRTVTLVQSLNAPGEYEVYFGAGGENPPSFYRVFSDEVLEAAFNSQPVHSNKYGQFFEVTPSDYEQLRDMNSSISFIKINQGGMMAPYYNSKSTKIVNVVEGNGYFEMACPHVASQSHGPQTREGVTESTSYKKLYAYLSPGDALVIPAGHPVTFIANQNQELQLVSFGINAQNNKRNFLAGQENVLNQLEKEAKELSFNTRAEEVEEILKNQKDSYFVAGPPKEFEEREEKGGRGQRLSSILD
ncbi:Cupin 1 [Dillenia turbinata]|uniref:Cupin 1 n=1 Tax=Dillenia turbinata TaxID=194707 RepID=A0AAN8UH70_9MAGN